MTYYKRGLSLRALTQALTTRAEHLKVPPNEPVCVYDAARTLGLRVNFRCLETREFEGLYQPSIGEILLEPRRPSLRQRFTCAHELGHHVFGHGQVGNCSIATDGSLQNTNTPQEEFLANTFAAFFLMPKAAVNTAFLRAGTTLADATPVDFYIAATTLGVGYRTLVNHCATYLSVRFPPARAAEFRKRKLAPIKAAVLGECGTAGNFSGTAYKITKDWKRPIDLVVGNEQRRSDIAKFEFEIESIPPNIQEVAPNCYRALKEGSYGVRAGEWTGEVRCYNPTLNGWWHVRIAGDDD